MVELDVDVRTDDRERIGVGVNNDVDVAGLGFRALRRSVQQGIVAAEHDPIGGCTSRMVGRAAPISSRAVGNRLRWLAYVLRVDTT